MDGHSGVLLEVSETDGGRTTLLFDDGWLLVFTNPPMLCERDVSCECGLCGGYEQFETVLRRLIGRSVTIGIDRRMGGGRKYIDVDISSGDGPGYSGVADGTIFQIDKRMAPGG